jgi:hypothetical protein
VRYLILLCLFCTNAILLGQNPNVDAVLTSKLETDADAFSGYDSFGYSYQIKNNVFRKIKKNEIFEYKNIALGTISKTDILNPLKIVLFYEDFNSAILLDNQLNKITEINFSQNDIPLVVNAIGMAAQNQLWVYNVLSQQIGLYDYLKNDYKTISVPLTEAIKYYQTDFNTFYWIDKKNDWYSCDRFGKITSLGNIADFDIIEIIDSQKYIRSKDNFLYFNTRKGSENTEVSEIKVLEKSFHKFYYKDQILSIFTDKEIVNYKIVTP